MTVTVLHGDCREVLRTLEPESVHCVVTSPPYFGLRDYGVAGQIGLEPTPDAYIAELVAVFAEVRRVLRKDGTVWLNLGDSYANDGKWGGHTGGKHVAALHCSPIGRNKKYTGMKPKDLLMIPARVALALQTDGWWLRSDIIWSKPNPMPESVTDRPTSAHEHVFLLAKAERYFFDADAVREPIACPIQRTTSYETFGRGPRDGGNEGLDGLAARMRAGEHTARNIRNVWTIATSPYPEAHFATFPPELAERCIKAGCPEKCCAKCGAPWVRDVAVSSRPNWAGDGQKHDGTYYRPNPGGGVGNDRRERIDRGFITSCECYETSQETFQQGAAQLQEKGADPIQPRPAAGGEKAVPGVVLDPFGGAGTTGLVADRLQRNAILIELNGDYVAIAQNRIHNDAPLFA